MVLQPQLNGEEKELPRSLVCRDGWRCPITLAPCITGLPRHAVLCPMSIQSFGRLTYLVCGSDSVSSGNEGNGASFMSVDVA